MSDKKTFNWKPTCNIPDAVLLNKDGTITLPIQLKTIVDKVGLMSDKEKLNLLFGHVNLSDQSNQHVWGNEDKQ